ncbi:hypothetical protein [Nocardia bhagyanarayanae]|uniref:Uncharacterized protein n=1 Tax=Nocardia bhagyanarayanae TaxID=1215925 RepID=A0A543EY45_9NOCA|nr:hypothetical protein [Nocardia bhagyanarayanae]TQM26513.1 hypothetical protein FB390_6712 [Nocardia bhagyanarayanae]
MTIEHPIEDEVTQLARRVEKARGRLAYQFDPALTEALSEDELHAERELAERIREQDRGQRWKEVQAAAVASDRARHTAEEIAKADMRDLLLARKAIAAQRRESSPHAKLASLYRHRAWSLRALAGVVGAGMLWSAVNVQHNIAPGGPSDPLYWFSYLLEGMISVCLIIIMIGTNKVAEWGVVDNRRQVAAAEMALLSLTVGLNTYPYLRSGQWYEVAVHAIAPVMIGVALLIHDAASARYGLAIHRATEQVRDMPDPAEQIRASLPALVRRESVVVAAERPAPAPRAEPEVEEEQYAEPEVDETDTAEAAPEDAPPARVEKRRAPAESGQPAANGNGKAPATAEPLRAEKPAAAAKVDKPVVEPAPARTPEPVAAKVVVRQTPPPPTKPIEIDKPAASRPATESASIKMSTKDSRIAKDSRNAKDSRKAAPPDPDNAYHEVVRSSGIYDTGQFRIAEALEQELAEMQEARRRARTGRQR